MKIRILTVCPERFGDFLNAPLVARSTASGLLDIRIVDIRDFAPGSFRRVDDSPYGGGAGMILRAQPVVDALKAYRSAASRTVILAPTGTRFDQKKAHELAGDRDLVFICGHYEGLDQRIYDFADEVISIGDYILSGGELAAMVICESVLRLLDGSMKKESVTDESFENGLLEYPQYTRPADYEGMKVPEVLLSGDHQAIAKWRREQSLLLTRKNRPDLLEAAERDEEDLT